jgi:DNA-binding NarL/FixJ family response regulator
VIERIRTVIVEDDMLTRAGLHAVLATDPAIEIVGDAATAADGVRVVRDALPDVVLLDVQLPDRDGIEVVGAMTEPIGDHAARVIVLTTFDYDDYLFRALRAGASAFLLKRSRAEDLIDAIRTVAGGDELPIADETRRLIASSTAAAAAAPHRDLLEVLTPRESSVLTLIARGLSNQEIADELGVSLETVRTHVKHVYWKCGARDRAHAVIAAYESGLVPRPG